MDGKKSSVVIDLKLDESISIDNGRVVLRLKEKSGKSARLWFLSNSDVEIKREKGEAPNHASRGIRLAPA
jgi:hypothetical protein